MCQIFVSADPRLYACRSRSIRLRGVATSLRLENLFWEVLEEIGARDDLTVPQLVSRLYDELMATGASEAHTNFTSFLRVSCTRFLQRQVAGQLPAEPPGVPDTRHAMQDRQATRLGALPHPML